MIATLLLALQLAQVDGGAPDAVFAESVKLLEGDAGVPQLELERLDPSTRQATAAFGLVKPPAGPARWVELGAGCWLPLPACMTKGKKVEQLLAENEELKRRPTGLEPLFRAAWVGFAAGALTAVLAIGGVCQVVTGNVLCR